MRCPLLGVRDVPKPLSLPPDGPGTPKVRPPPPPTPPPRWANTELLLSRYMAPTKTRKKIPHRFMVFRLLYLQNILLPKTRYRKNTSRLLVEAKKMPDDTRSY